MEEKIKEILINNIDYCDCDLCKYFGFEKECYGCYQKYCNWTLSEKTAEDLANNINTAYQLIINYLLQALEEEHMGLSHICIDDIEKRYGVRI